MQLFSEITPLREALAGLHGSLGLVPTMGALHEGHLELVRRAKQVCDRVVVSIFVNPAQFNSPADLERYPRDVKRDLELLQAEKVELVFSPHESEIYGENFESWITPPALAARLEGRARPGHFRGVVTIVNKLFNIVSPSTAFFGEKDFQQLRVIEKMVEDLNIPVTIARVPTVREADGLAMSSRNALLSASERESAAVISRALYAARSSRQSGEASPAKLITAARREIAAESRISVEYIEIVDELRLEPAEKLDCPVRMMIAVRLGDVRLIDNIAL